MPSLAAGVAKRDITPPVGIDLTGYGGRPSGCTDIHDPIHARALVLSDGGSTVALVSLDVLGIDFDVRDQLRDRAMSLGTPSSALVLNASHTHAGPATQRLRGLGEPDPEYVRRFVDATAAAIEAALASMAPARLAVTRGPARIGHNRRDRVGVVVPHVDVLSVTHTDGSPLATWFAHACHPTTLGGGNLSVSAEYPGVAADSVERRHGGVALFAQGCCGDINPTERGDFPAVEHNGRTLAGAVLGALAPATGCVDDVSLAAHIEVADLSLQPAPDRGDLDALIAEAEAAAERGRDDATGRGAQRMLDASVEWLCAVRAESHGEAPAPTARPFEVQAVRIGDAALVTLPGEVFAETGSRIEAASPFQHTTALAYTNGCHGYVPTASAYREGGYEVDDAIRYYGTLMFAPSSEAEILAAAARALHEVAA